MNPEQLDEVRTALHKACQGMEGKSSRLQVGELGTFGRKQSPSVLWAAIQGELAPLRALQHRIGTAMQELLRIEPEKRPFKPHLTLARTYKAAAGWDPELTRLHLPAHDVRTSWPFEEVVLYRSHLGQTPMYEPISKHSLD